MLGRVVIWVFGFIGYLIFRFKDVRFKNRMGVEGEMRVFFSILRKIELKENLVFYFCYYNVICYIVCLFMKLL